jgi:Uma2 family endonuclease
MSHIKTKLPIDEWLTATWDEYLQIIANPQLEKAKSYYHDGQLRIEMTSQGYDHLTIISRLICRCIIQCYQSYSYKWSH